MSKAIQGAVLLGVDAAMFVALAVGTAGVGLALAPIFNALAVPLLAGGLALEAGAIAGALMSSVGSGYTVRQPAPFRQVIYGEQRVGGIWAYLSTTGSHLDQNNFVIVIAGHEVDAIENLYLDGRQVFWAGGVGNCDRNGVNFGGAANSTTYTGPGGAQYNFGTLVYCEARYGDQTLTQAGPNFPSTTASVIGGLTANDPNWAADGSGNAPLLMGCCYVYLKLEYDIAMFPDTPGGVQVKFTVRGKNNILDPRTGLAGYSTNPALIVADIILDTTFGLADVDAFKDAGSVAQLIAAANICDEQIDVEATGGTEAQYSGHYHYDASTAPGDAINLMLQAMGARISMPGGEWYIFPAAWVGPSFDFDAGALAGPLSWKPYRSQKDLFNRVNGTYIAPNWPWNTAGNLYDANGFYNGTIQNNFGFAFNPASVPQYAADVQHGYAYDAYLEEDSGLLGPWASGTTYNLGDVVSYSAGSPPGPLVMYKSLIANNLGNEPDLDLAPAWAIGSTYAMGAQVTYSGLPYFSLSNGNTGNEPDTSPDDWSTPTAYDSGTTYAQGAVVTDDGNTYFSVISGNVGNTPLSNPAYWQFYQALPQCWAPYAKTLNKELTLRTVLSVTQAQRLFKIELLRNRFQGSGTLAMKQAAFVMQACDVMNFTFPAMNWAGKTLEVLGPTSAIDYGDQQTAPRETLSMLVGETDASIYEWDPATEEMTVYGVPANTSPVYEGYPASPPAVPSAIAAPTGLTLASSGSTAVLGTDGVNHPRILATWTDPADVRAVQIQVQYQLVGAGSWTDIGTVALGVEQAYISGVISGNDYDVQIRALAASGATSAWVSAGPVTASAPASFAGSVTFVDTDGSGTLWKLTVAGGGQVLTKVTMGPGVSGVALIDTVDASCWGLCITSGGLVWTKITTTLYGVSSISFTDTVDGSTSILTMAGGAPVWTKV